MPQDRIDPLAPVHPYRQIARIIKRQIMSGQYPPHTRIPTESELVETYEVARSTARRAVKALRDEGLVYTVPQRGISDGMYYAKRADGTGETLTGATPEELNAAIRADWERKTAR